MANDICVTRLEKRVSLNQQDGRTLLLQLKHNQLKEKTFGVSSSVDSFFYPNLLPPHPLNWSRYGLDSQKDHTHQLCELLYQWWEELWEEHLGLFRNWFLWTQRCMNTDSCCCTPKVQRETDGKVDRGEKEQKMKIDMQKMREVSKH